MQITHECNGPGLIDYPSAMPVKDVNVYMHDSGMICTHDYSCPVCREHHAVLDLSNGIMRPCHNCTLKGYFIGKRNIRSLWKRIFGIRG